MYKKKERKNNRKAGVNIQFHTVAAGFVLIYDTLLPPEKTSGSNNLIYN